MTEKQKIIMWVAVGLVGAGIIVYFGMNGSFSPAAPITSSSSSPSAETAGSAEPSASGPIEIPKASEPIKASEIPAKAVKLTISASGFSPSSFTVNEGDRLMLAITSSDQFTHTFSFDDASLSNFSVGLAAGETRTIEFIVPKQGEYVFRCGLPGHADRGETGKMVVK